RRNHHSLVHRPRSYQMVHALPPILSLVAAGPIGLMCPVHTTGEHFDRSIWTMADPKQPSRTEKDSMGEMKVPADAYYGAQTGRAVENFPISDLRFSRGFIAAMGLIK